MRRLFYSFAALVATSLGTASAAVIIDDFTTPNGPNVTRPPGTVDEVSPATNTLFGTRYVGISRQSGTVSGTVGGGAFTFSETASALNPTGPGQGGFTLNYDGVDDNLAGTGSNARTVDLTQNGLNNGISILASATGPTELILTAFNVGGTFTANLQLTPTGGLGNFETFFVPFSSFTGFTGLTKAFSVRSVTGTGPSQVTADVAISSIAATPAVPEPGTLALLGTGLVGLALRLRRRGKAETSC